MKVIDVTGLRFGRLVVTHRSARKSNAGALWECVCDCGGHTVTTSLKLKTGHTSSCGCIRNEIVSKVNVSHGHANKNRTYKSWKEMRQRCLNKNSDKWKWYGGRGIAICDKWGKYEEFLNDMGERPDGMSIDRIDPDGHYEPENCRWATPKQQAETNRGLFKPGSVPWNLGIAGMRSFEKSKGITK